MQRANQMKKMTTNNRQILSTTPTIYVKGRYSATKVTLSEKSEGLYVVPSTWVLASVSISDDNNVIIYQRPRADKKSHSPNKGAKVKRPPAPKARVVEISFES
jgi:hypothetical protein